MEAETDFSSTLRASSSAKAQRTLTVLIPVPAPPARRKQNQGENSVTLAHTRRMVSEQPDKLGAQPVDAGADERRSLCHVRKEPEQGSIDRGNPNCARPEIFSQVIEPTDHVLWNPLRPTELAIGILCSKVKKKPSRSISLFIVQEGHCRMRSSSIKARPAFSRPPCPNWSGKFEEVIPTHISARINTARRSCHFLAEFASQKSWPAFPQARYSKR